MRSDPVLPRHQDRQCLRIYLLSGEQELMATEGTWQHLVGNDGEVTARFELHQRLAGIAAGIDGNAESRQPTSQRGKDILVVVNDQHVCGYR